MLYVPSRLVLYVASVLVTLGLALVSICKSAAALTVLLALTGT